MSYILNRARTHKKSLLSLVFFLALSSLAQAQLMIQTLILVRHAEVEQGQGSNPDLSFEGKKRAERLAALLSKQKIDLVLSSKLERTIQTAQSTANQHGLAVVRANDLAETIEHIRNIPYQGTALLVGHSNTLPQIVAELNGPVIKIGHDDHSQIFMVTILAESELSTVELSY